MNSLLQFSKRYAMPLWRWYLFGMMALALTTWLTLTIPKLAKEIVNQIDQNADLNSLQGIALLMIALGFLQLIVRGLSRIGIFWPARRIEANSKSELFAHLMSLPQRFFDQQGMGDLISRLTNDLGQLRVLFAFGALMFINMIFLSVFVISEMIRIHATLALLSMIPMLLMLLISKQLMPLFQEYSKRQQEAVGTLTNQVTEAFSNVHVIQSNAAQDAFLDRSEGANQHLFETNMKLIRIQTFLFPLMTCLTGISHMVILFYGSHQVIAGALTIGDILVFNVYIGLLSFPLTAVGIIMSIYQRARTALDRMNIIWTTTPEESTEYPPDLKIPSDNSPLIQIKNLIFEFDKDQPVIQNFNLNIEAGEKIGFFGPVGSGKTTLFNLLTRIYPSPPGAIRFHNRDLNEWNPQELRSKIAYCLQTPYLFSESISKNINFGIGQNLSESQLIEMTKQAQVWEDIRRFEKGLETPIGEKGIRLSGGQKQRIALARVLARPSEVLILDDVLSAVDQVTEQNLIQEIHRQGRTLLISSHRTDVLKLCDRIVLLEHGKILNVGKYWDLEDQIQELSQLQKHSKSTENSESASTEGFHE